MTETELITGLRVVGRNNFTLASEQFLIGPTKDGIITQVDVAMMLDLAREDGIERRGGSGTGAGAHLEALFDGDDPKNEDCDGEKIDSLFHPLVTTLPIGSTSILRKFIAGQRRSTIWDGNNHVAAPHNESDDLLARIRK